jgi:pyruvate dehydrogenase E2 component (dihydrolipoamide acetyltransferase)
VLVGYGAKGGHTATRRRRPGAAVPVAGAPGAPASAPVRVAPRLPGAQVIAKPPIRKLAKDLDVDLAEVTATGPGGEVLRDDVIRQAQQASVFRNIQTPAWPTEREERIPVKGVRKATAQAMVASAFTAPHVSVFTDVNATRTMEFVKRLKASPDFAGVRVSPLLVMAKAVIWAVRRNPTVNSSWGDKEITVHHYVNLGIAAATPRGLIVPNIKDAGTKTLAELSTALSDLVATAREGKTSPADMQGGTVTITNVGVFGVDTGTPILNPPEAAILALGQVAERPWVVDGAVLPRSVVQLALAFDHRLVDGELGSLVLAEVGAILQDPALALAL